ncbi:hypothetical protein M0R04_08365 [Candidatus Dojkabacteria bacterium]|jgi:hypothetical protein|nr:hypothetical protein [Candidatus Dojkabacteria bacterium]
MEYTKGDWKHKMSTDGSRMVYAEKENGDTEFICDDIRHFNVGLVCASPDMYEILRKVYDRMIKHQEHQGLHFYDELLPKMAKALAKAEGRE